MNPSEHDPPPGTAITSTGSRHPPRANTGGSDLAEMIPVSEPFRQRVRGRGYKLKVNLLELIPLVYFFGGLALAGVGIWLITKGYWPVGCLLLVAGLPATCWAIYVALLCSCVTSNRWIARRLRYEISQRADSLVDPCDPESIYVSLIPPEHFSEIRWTYATDVLLLKIDTPRRQLLLEGDSDRYRIPAAAIARCGVRPFTIPIDATREFWMVRLVVDFEDEDRELLLSVDHTRWVPTNNASRERIAEGICQRIEAMLK